MTWLALLGNAWELIAAGFIAAVVIGIVTRPADEGDADEEQPDDDASDRGHDLWVDRETGVSL